MSDRASVAAERTIRHYLLAGVACCLLLVGGAGGLAAMTELSGAVVASGIVVVDSNVKKVQHPTGGVVSRINVREGDKVHAGDVLMSLDATVTRANLAIVTKGLDELNVRMARLRSERDGKDEIDFSAIETAAQRDPEMADLMAGELSLFRFRQEARLGQKAQLQQRIAQLAEQVAGLTEQRDAKRKETALVGTELESVRSLWAKKLVSLERTTALEREAVRIEGEHGQLTASIAEAKGRLAEIELQIIQIDQDMRSEVATEMRDAQGRIAELTERKVGAEDALKHIELRSPQDGVVHQLAVHTIGGVIAAAEPVMLVVPITDALTVETKIQPQDIDQVLTGQKAFLRMSAFSQRTTPEVNGIVVQVSPDLTVDPRTGASFYMARISLPAVELAKLKGLALTPGMPVEVFLPTGNRTMLSYLIKPLADQIERAFREG